MRRIGMTVVGAGLVLLLGGCFLLPKTPLQRPPSAAPATGGPHDWSSLPHCENGPPDPWVLVDDFPTEIIESAGITGECGDTYFDADLPTYVSIADSAVSLAELEALGTAFEAAGYERTEDSFRPVDANSSPGAAGGWEYTLRGESADDDILVYVINFWSGEDPDRYFTYIDVETPTTRAFER
jgi:hypothetical protein